jgi:hypothetical protein
MRATLGQERSLVSPADVRTSSSPSAKEIHYDHVATFTLTGQRGNRIQDVLNIPIEGAFVAEAIGYSFVPAVLDLTDPPGPLSRLPAQRATEAIANHFLQILADLPGLHDTLAVSLVARLCGIDFKYSIVDSGTGRELQNKPIHNIAGLGEASGDRPFRPLAKPMLFMPRSTIRIEVEEISQGALYENAQLFIVLHGYKILGYGAS